MNSISLRSTVVGLALIVSGCSANYIVTKQTAKVSPVLAEKGIYYSLPKTEIMAGVDFTLNSVTTGAWRNTFQKNLVTCQDDPSMDVGVKLSDAKITKPSIIDEVPFILTRSKADPNHRYLLEVKFGMFSSFSHTVELTDEGVITTADSSVTNFGVEVAKLTLSTIKDIALTVAGGPAALATMNLESVAPPKPSKSCELILKTYDVDQKVKEFEDRRAQYVRTISLQATPETLANTVASFDAEETAARAAYGTYEDTDGTEKRIKYLDMIGQWVSKLAFRYIDVISPDEFQDYNKVWKGVLLKVAIGTPSGMPILKVQASPELNAFVTSKLNLTIKVKPVTAFKTCALKTDPTTADVTSMYEKLPKHCRDDVLKGYRYRLPAKGTVTLISGGDEIAESVVAIAQYGAIATLPNKISGLEGTINLTMNGESGALKKIVVGAKPLPSSTISDFADIGTDYIAQKRKAKAAAKEAAENQELNSILKENQLLEAQKKNLELKTSLGIEP